MITILQKPENLVFAKSPVWIRASSDNLYSAQGSYASLTILITGDAVNGNSFRFTFMGKQLQFTCATVPDTSGYQFTPASASNLPTILSDLFFKNYQVSANYTVSLQGDEIILTAKQKGVASSISISNITVSGMSGTAVAGTDQIVRTNFKIILQLFENDHLFYEEQLDVDTEGLFETNISELLTPYLETKFISGTQTDVIHLNSDMSRKFSFRLAEYYDYTVRLFTSVNSFYALKGGYSKRFEQYLNTNAITAHDWLTSPVILFLTWMPNGINIATNQASKIYFVNATSVSGLRLVCDMYEDEVNFESIQLDELNNINPFDVFEIDISPARFSLESYVRYDMYLTNWAGDIITEKLTFYPFTETKPFYYDVAFCNSLGGYDIVRLRCKAEQEADYEHILAESSAGSDFDFYDSEKIKLNTFETEKLTLFTEWLTSESLDWMRDLYFSKDVILLGENPTKYIVTSKKRNKRVDSEFVYNYEFELELGHKDVNYSKI